MDAFGRAVDRPRREVHGGEAHQVHRLRREADHRPAHERRGRREGGEALPISHHRGRREEAAHRGGDQGGEPAALRARGDQRHGLGQDEADRREELGAPRLEGRRHCPRVLQRRAATGHQERRVHRRAAGAAHHQRAHGGGLGLRPGPEGGHGQGLQHPHLRPRRRHLRCVGAEPRGRHLPGPGHGWRHQAWRGGLRQRARGLARHRVQGQA
mmetsp:Transcript_141935/g.441293  ORF Transcript_141935/g.441293 Transcript_141935/m.441293 type:complete len:212 (+) Transcript_141935:723-1358(+)